MAIVIEIEIQKKTSATAVKDARNALLAVKLRQDRLKASLEKVDDLIAQNEFFAHEINTARGRIYTMLLEEYKLRESLRLDECIDAIGESVRLLEEAKRKAGA